MRNVDLTDPENPEWTREDFQRARPASDVHGEALASLLVRKNGSHARTISGQAAWLSARKLAA